MGLMNLATFNIFWYPDSKFAGNQRSEADHRLVGRVLTNLNAHVIVFQEILKLGQLETLLATIGGHDYQLRKEPGGKQWLSSGKAQSTASQKIACAYDAAVLDLIDAAALINPESYPGYKRRRDPYALHLRVHHTGWEFTLVGVHLKSNDPKHTVPDPEYSDDKDLRQLETEFLARWLSGDAGLETGHFQMPPTQDVVIMGDFNAERTLAALKPLSEGSMPGWSWPAPRIIRSVEPEQLVTDPDEAWSTLLDRVVIDHALVSPGVKPWVRDASVYAFDLDPALDEQPGTGGHWLRTMTDYQVPCSGEFKEVVRNMYRISDHRPVRVTVESP